ncbi:MAG TPA: hypothetical protein VGK44_17155 [Casimicrobiaceae bacterium]
MNDNFRRFFCVLLTMALATFALPSLGASQKNKMYSLTTTSSAPTQIEAHLTNVSVGTGNSTITTFKLTFAGVAIASVDLDPAFKETKQGGTQSSIANTPAGATVTVTNTYPIKVGGPTYNLVIHLGDCGNGIALTGATGNTGAGGDAFDPSGTAFPLLTDVICGNIACGTPSTAIPSSSYSATVMRGTYDKDGASTIDPNQCATVAYTVTKLDSINVGEKKFAWPTTGTDSDPSAAFQYTINNDPTKYPNGLTQVGWLPTTGDATLITGPRCESRPTMPGTDGVLPAPYGTLAAADTGGATITVDTTTLVVARPATALVNFDVIIGTDRLTVNFSGTGPTNAEVWNVVARDVGGTVNTPTATSYGVMGQPVMYTPLPLLPGVDPVTLGTLPSVGSPYADGKQAQMCIVKRVAASGGYTTIIDIGDGHSSP